MTASILAPPLPARLCDDGPGPALAPPARPTHLPPPGPALQDKETQHRVIVGRDYYEPQGVDPQVSGRSPAGSLPQLML